MEGERFLMKITNRLTDCSRCFYVLGYKNYKNCIFHAFLWLFSGAYKSEFSEWDVSIISLIKLVKVCQYFTFNGLCRIS